MAEPASTDPYERLELLGYKGTGSVEKGEQPPVSSTSGTLPVIFDISTYFGQPAYDWPYSSAFYHHIQPSLDETSRMQGRLQDIEREADRLQEMRFQIQEAQELWGADNVYSLFTSVHGIGQEVSELQSDVERIEKRMTEELSTKDSEAGTLKKTEHIERVVTGMSRYFIITAQIAFALLALLALGMGIWAQNSIVGLAGTLSAPLFIALAFAGVLAEKLQITPIE